MLPNVCADARPATRKKIANSLETRAFLDRRIENVMQFEKAKAQLLSNREGFDVARFLGRLRYPAR